MDAPGTPARQAAVLAAFRTTASVSRACAAAKVARRQHYTWIVEDPDYAAKFEVARDEAAQQLEDEAVRRAHKGYLEPVVFQGNFTYPPKLDEGGLPVYDSEGRAVADRDKPLCIRRHSDALLMFLLKAWRPVKYRESWKGELSGPAGGPISLTETRLRKLNDEQLTSLAELVRLLSAKSEGD